MHLALIISSLNPGGAEHVLSQLANYWVEQGHQITLLTLSPPGQKPFYPLDQRISLIQMDKMGPQTLSFKRLSRLVSRFFCLRKYLKDLKPDVVISFMDIMNMTTLVSTRGLKLPVIVSERSHPGYHKIFPFLDRLRLALYKRAAAVVMQTDSAASYFKRLSRIHVIPNPVARPSLTKGVLSPAPNQIVSVGSLIPLKGHATLIRAFATLVSDAPHLRLTIYGEGPARASLETLSHSLNLQDKVSLPGTTPHIQDALYKADLFVFPSHYEGFPNALCEAMAVGLPVIASDCSGNVDVVRESRDGRLFPVGDEKALALLIRELLNDPAQCSQLGKEASTIGERFEPTLIFSRWDQMITEATW